MKKKYSDQLLGSTQKLVEIHNTGPFDNQIYSFFQPYKIATVQYIISLYYQIFKILIKMVTD